MTMGDRIEVMKDGLIQQEDSPQKLYDSPCNVFVAGFIGSPQMNFIDAVLVHEGDDYYAVFGSEDKKDRVGVKYKIKLPASKNEDDRFAEYVGQEIVMGIRPENLYDDPALLPKYADGLIKANVEVTELMGAEIYLYLSCEGHALTARVAPTSTARPGDTIEVAFDTSKVMLFDKDTERVICN